MVLSCFCNKTMIQYFQKKTLHILIWGAFGSPFCTKLLEVWILLSHITPWSIIHQFFTTWESGSFLAPSHSASCRRLLRPERFVAGPPENFVVTTGKENSLQHQRKGKERKNHVSQGFSIMQQLTYCSRVQSKLTAVVEQAREVLSVAEVRRQKPCQGYSKHQSRNDVCQDRIWIRGTGFSLFPFGINTKCTRWALGTGFSMIGNLSSCAS